MKKRHLLTIVTCLLTSCTNTVYRTDSTPDDKSRMYYLPKGEVHLKIERKENDSPIEFEITSTFIADAHYPPLYLHRNHSIWYDDKYVVETDKYGLLQSINATTDFKGDEIIKKVGELAASTAKLATFELREKATKVQPKFCDTDKFKIEIHFDPYVDSYESINARLPANKCVNVYYDNRKIVEPQIGAIDSILYRHFVNFPITVNFNNSEQSKTLTVALPDINTIEHVNIDRSYFVDRETKLTFINGVLTKDELTYPSEALGFISLPLAIVNGISSAVTGTLNKAGNGL